MWTTSGSSESLPLPFFDLLDVLPPPLFFATAPSSLFTSFADERAVDAFAFTDFDEAIFDDAFLEPTTEHAALPASVELEYWISRERRLALLLST